MEHLLQIVVIFGILIGLTILSFRIIRDAINSIRSKKWPSVPGVMTVMTSEEELSTSPKPQLRCEYSYTVGGSKQTCKLLAYGVYNILRIDKKQLEQIARQYPEGKEVTVYYDPRKPSRAVLEPGSRGAFWLQFLVILACEASLILGALSLILDLNT